MTLREPLFEEIEKVCISHDVFPLWRVSESCLEQILKVEFKGIIAHHR